MKKIIVFSALLILISTLFPNTSNAATTSCVLKTKSAYKSSVSEDVYYITGSCTKQIFPNESVFFTYFTSWSKVILTDDLTLRFIPNDPQKYVDAKDGSSSGSSGSGSSGSSSNSGTTERAESLIVRDGSIIKSRGNSTVYLVINNVKFHIKNMETLQELGIPLRWIEIVAEKTIEAIPSGTSLNVHSGTRIMSQATPDFMLLKDKNSSGVYRVEPSTKDPKYQILRKISNEVALRKTGYRLDRLPQVTIEEIPELSLIGVSSKTVFRVGSDLTSNSTVSYQSNFEDTIEEKRSAKNEGAYLRNEKHEGISYEYPWKYRVLRGFSYANAFRDEYMASFTSPSDGDSALYLMISPLPSKSSSYTKEELDELIQTRHDNAIKAEFPDTSSIRRSSSEWKRQVTYGYTRITNLEFYNGTYQKRITFIYKKQIFSGIIRYTTSPSAADFESLLYFIANTFKKN